MHFSPTPPDVQVIVVTPRDQDWLAGPGLEQDPSPSNRRSSLRALAAVMAPQRRGVGPL
jgi:hypothetical protein